MSGTFKTKGGESWFSVAVQTSGKDTDADVIRRANPGLAEPLPAGANLIIPVDTPESSVETPLGISISVCGLEIKTFTSLEIGLAIDAITKASFVVPNEPETRALFAPYSSPHIVIKVDGETVLAGRCGSPKPDNSYDTASLSVECYSYPGILEISHPPIDAFPLEWQDRDLRRIAEDLCRYHGISCEFQAGPGARFKRVDIQPEQEILGFLSELSRQRGPVMTSSPEGRLKFWLGVDTGSPVARLRKGLAPVVSVETSLDDSRYYSSVTGIIPAHTKRGKGEKYTVRNPFASDLIRPFQAEFSDIEAGEIKTAVETQAGRMFAAMFDATVDLATWKNDGGDLWRPNTTVTLKAEEDFIKTDYEFLISEVTLSASPDALTARLHLVLPGVYGGKIPEKLPWQ